MFEIVSERHTDMSLFMRFTRTFHTCVTRVAAKNHYEVLGVSRDASQKEIKEAFITLSKQLHPDVKKSSDKSQISFVDVNEAYSVLGNSISRREYDIKQRHGPVHVSPYKTHPRAHGAQPIFWQHAHRHHDKEGQFYGFSYSEFKNPSSSRFSNNTVFGFICGVLLIATLLQYIRFLVFHNNLKGSIEESRQRQISYSGGFKERVRRVQQLRSTLQKRT